MSDDDGKKKPFFTVNSLWGGAMLVMGVSATILAKLQLSTKANGSEKCYVSNDTDVGDYGTDDTISAYMKLSGFKVPTDFNSDYKAAFKSTLSTFLIHAPVKDVSKISAAYTVNIVEVYTAAPSVIMIRYDLSNPFSSIDAYSSRKRLDYVQANPANFASALDKTFSKTHTHTPTPKGFSVVIDSGAKVWNEFCTFSKPWFICLEMKFAMACCLIWHFATMKPKKNPRLSLDDLGLEKDDALLGNQGEEEEHEVDPRCYYYLAGPAFLDMTQTVMGNVGLVFVSSSIYQMCKGSVIVFSALFMVKFLGAKLYRHHYASMGFIVVAIAMVGVAGVMEDSGTSTSSSEKMLGIISILLAQIIMAAQIVSEEYLMTKMHCSPVLVVGMEGLWGLLFFAIIGPILTHTPQTDSQIGMIFHEDFYDSFVKIGSNHPLLAITIVETFIIGAYNLTANYVTQRLNAVVRSILEACRTLGVWVLDLAFYYVFTWRGDTSPAEKWSKYSVLEFFGFCVLVYGTFAYKELVPIPGIPPSPDKGK